MKNKQNQKSYYKTKNKFKKRVKDDYSYPYMNVHQLKNLHIKCNCVRANSVIKKHWTEGTDLFISDIRECGESAREIFQTS